MPLNTLLWALELDEASGARADAVGSLSGGSLTSVNSVGARTGIKGNAASFVRTSSQRLVSADTTLLSAILNALNTGSGWSMEIWFYLDDLSAAQRLIILANCLYIDVATTGVCTVSFKEHSSGFNRNFGIGTLGAAGWYQLLITCDNTTARGYVNDGAQAGSAALSKVSASFSSSDRVAVGAQANQFTSSLYVNGAVDMVRFWNNYVLTADDRTYLYNGGAGRTYAEITGGGTSSPISLAGTADGQASASAALLHELLTSGAASGTGTAEAALQILRQLEAVATGTGSTSGTLQQAQTISLSGSAQGQAQAAAAIEIARYLAGLGSGLSSAGIEARRDILLAGVASGSSEAQGTITQSAAILLAGTARGVSQAEAVATISRLLEGRASGASAAEAALFLERLLAGLAFGTSGASGSLMVGTIIRPDRMQVEVRPFYEIAMEARPFYEIEMHLEELIPS